MGDAQVPGTRYSLNTIVVDCGANSHETSEGGCECEEGFAGDGKTCGDDADMDGVPDADLDCKGDKCKKDNCPDVPNSEQEDQDKDDLGDK